MADCTNPIATQSVFIGPIVLDNLLKRATPENLTRTYERAGERLENMPGKTQAGNFVHQDHGLSESSGRITINLTFIRETDLNTLYALHKTPGGTTIQVGDARGNEWTCVWAPGTEGFIPVEKNRSAGMYDLTMNFNIVSKTVDVSP